MIVIQTLLGGITRLTGSGLSITKWDPIFGILPPLNDKQWQGAFDGYKQIGQFKFMNSAYSLTDFKSIFFWEWLHRFFARMLGLVFLAGFAFFLVKKYFDRNMVKPFIVLFLLGALQGLIGWVMVGSGLNDSHLYVDHIRLALHFVAAMILACYTLWFALILLVPEKNRVYAPQLKVLTIGITILLFVQLAYGAFMAGLKAAMAAPTWPGINGMWVPKLAGGILYDKINIHFVHRTLAFLLFISITAWFVMAARAAAKNVGSLLAKTRWWPFVFVWLQVMLGICTVLSAPQIVPGSFGRFQLLAEMHQMVAMFLLLSLIVNLYVIKRGGRVASL